MKYYVSNIVGCSDYYPFGMVMPGRNGGGNYRYGYGSHENDNEVSGNGNHLSFGDYGYNPRLGRRFQIDPMIGTFPWMSPYATFNNSPIYFADPTGLSPEKESETPPTDYGVTEGGKIYQIGEENKNPDKLFKIDNGKDKNKIDINDNGRTSDHYVSVQDKTILSSLKENEGTFTYEGETYDNAPKGKDIAYSTNRKDIAKLFYFFANYTEIEFVAMSFKDGNNVIGTSHRRQLSLSFNDLTKIKKYTTKDVVSWIHNHPHDDSHKTLNGRLWSMEGDNSIVQEFIKNNTFTFQFHVYFPKYNETLELKKGLTGGQTIESYWGILKILK